MRAQLQQVDTLLAQATSPSATTASSPTSPAPTFQSGGQLCTTTSSPAATGGSPPAQAERPLKEVKKQLEDHLASLPQLPEFADARASLKQQLDDVITRIRNEAPPGARLDGAIAALNRAQARKAAAAEAVAKAQSAHEAAELECAQLAKDVDLIRASMASAPPVAAPRAQQFEEAANAMIAELASHAGTDPAHLHIARELSKQLITGFQTILASSPTSPASGTAAAQPVPPSPLPQVPRRRLVGKQLVETPQDMHVDSAGMLATIDDAVPRRLVGKQAKKVTLQDFWPGAHKGVLKSAWGKKQRS